MYRYIDIDTYNIYRYNIAHTPTGRYKTQDLYSNIYSGSLQNSSAKSSVDLTSHRTRSPQDCIGTCRRSSSTNPIHVEPLRLTQRFP